MSTTRNCVPHGLGCKYCVMKQRNIHFQIDDLMADMQLVRKLTSRTIVNHARL